MLAHQLDDQAAQYVKLALEIVGIGDPLRTRHKKLHDLGLHAQSGRPNAFSVDWNRAITQKTHAPGFYRILNQLPNRTVLRLILFDKHHAHAVVPWFG